MSCVMCHVSCVMSHVSCVLCHVSCVMCHVSRVTCHMPHVTNANSNSHGPYPNLFIYQARESSLVQAGFLMVRFQTVNQVALDPGVGFLQLT